jgi:hypothetical protein
MSPHCCVIDALNQVLSWDVSVEDCPRAVASQAALLAGLSHDDLDNVLH